MASRYSSRQSDPSPTSSKARRPGGDLAVAKPKNPPILGAMIKKFMDTKKPNSKPGLSDRPVIAIPVDLISGKSKGSSNLTTLHRKLFHKGGSAERKALTEVKTNTRTLSMVLRSERELMDRNQEYEAEVSELRSLLEEKDLELEKLRNLCLRQRHEIKALKDAILFPDEMNPQLQVVLEKQGSELSQANKVIPCLQKQVSSLTGQLQCLAVDLAEVKADKYGSRTCFDGHLSSPRTPILFREAVNSSEYSSGEALGIQHGTLDDMFLDDINPCLTPRFSKTKSKEYDGEPFHFDSPSMDASFLSSRKQNPDTNPNSSGGILLKSSENRQRPRLGSSAQRIHKSDETKWSAGKVKYNKHF